MKVQIATRFLLFAAVCCALAVTSLSQTTFLKRTTSKTDKFDFGAGGTVAIVGAPTGSISIEGWQKPEVEITAEIEMQAPTEADLSKLAEITGFALDQSLGRASIISIGSHLGKNKSGKSKLPKNLVGLPFRIDYTIKVPRYCDLEVDGGKGDLNITAVEGTMRINYLNSEAHLDLLGGNVT